MQQRRPAGAGGGAAAHVTAGGRGLAARVHGDGQQLALLQVLVLTHRNRNIYNNEKIFKTIKKIFLTIQKYLSVMTTLSRIHCCVSEIMATWGPPSLGPETETAI